MASTPGSERARQTIDLKILSPSPELREGIYFKSVPISTTIDELKERIQNEVVSHPPIDRQRLIYRGRSLQRGADTLTDVLGSQAIQDDQLHALHLVIPERHPPHHPPHHPVSSITNPSVPRSASVPPTSPTNPFRPAETAASTPAVPRNPFRHSTDGQQASQPQTPPQSQSPFPPGTRVNAQVTANGIPIQLPQEIINNLLNQHLAAHGGLPNIFQNLIQQQLQQHLQPQAAPTPENSNAEPQDPPASAPPMNGQQTSAIRTDGPTAFQQFIAQQQRERATGPPSSTSGASTPNHARQSLESLEAARAREPQPGRGATTPGETSVAARPQTSTPLEQREQHTAPQHNGTPSTRHPAVPPPSNISQPPIPHGQTFSMTWQSNGPAINQPIPRGPPPLPAIIPPSFMNPLLQHHAHPHPQPFRLGTPPVGMPPAGAVRSISPARPVSGGPRVPNMSELLVWQETQRHVLDDINRMVDLLASGVTANGEYRTPSQQEIDGLRVRVRVLVRDIENYRQQYESAFSMTGRQPHPLIDPQYAHFHMMHQAIQLQAQRLSQRIEHFSRHPETPGANPLDPSSIQNSANHPLPNGAPTGVPTPIDPAASTVPNAPNVVATAPAAAPEIPSTSEQPQLFLVMNPAGEPTALVVGPTGQYASPTLPPNILAAMLASQLPNDQLVAAFTQVVREAMQPTGLLSGLPRAALASLFPGVVPPTALTDDPRTREHLEQPREQGLPAQRSQQQQAEPSSIVGNQPAALPAQHAAGGQAGREDVPGGPNVQAQGAAAANGRPPDEMREILAPIIRNIWLIARIGFLIYLFAGGGRGFWRPMMLAGIGVVIWAFQAELVPRRYWDAIRQHWMRIAEGAGADGQQQQHARRQHPPTQAAAPGQAAVPAPTPRAAEPRDPQETANMLLARRQEVDRNWIMQRAADAYRTSAILVASLVPGIGENLVRETERRERETREAEERRRREEEAAKSKHDENSPQAEAAATGSETAVADGLARVNKGKGKASAEEVAWQEGAAPKDAAEASAASSVTR